MNVFVKALQVKAHDRKAINMLVREDMGCKSATLRAACCDVLTMQLTRNAHAVSFTQRMNAEANIKHLQSIGDGARKRNEYELAQIPQARKLVEELIAEVATA